MAYIDQISLAQDPTFLKRVQYAIVSSAINVRSEAVMVANHQARSAWAGSVLTNPTGYAILMASGFVTQAPIAGSAVSTTVAGVTTWSTPTTDAQLQTISDSLWNDYAVA